MHRNCAGILHPACWALRPVLPVSPTCRDPCRQGPAWPVAAVHIHHVHLALRDVVLKVRLDLAATQVQHSVPRARGGRRGRADDLRHACETGDVSFGELQH
jgi:hypothetical protein